MKIHRFVLFLLCICTGLSAQMPPFQWAKYATSSSGFEQGRGIARDASGNVYVVGDFGGPVDFNPGPGLAILTTTHVTDVFVVKYNNLGNYVWARRMGGTQQDFGYGITLDASGNIYLTGSFQELADFDPGAGTASFTATGMDDVFVVKLDPNGNYLWARAMGGTGFDRSYGIAVDASGNVFTTGEFRNTVDFDPGAGVANLSAVGQDIFVSALDNGGNYLWARKIGGAGDDRGYGIAVDASGNVWTTGIFLGPVDFDPGAGVMNVTGFGNADAFVSKLNPSGNYLWAGAMGSFGNDNGWGIACDPAGNVVTTGRFTGTADFNPGAPVFNLISNGFEDIYISKLNPSGGFLWAKSMGGPTNGMIAGADVGYGITVNGSGQVFTTGTFVGTVDFDPGVGIANLTSASTQTDVFVSALDAAGNYLWARAMGGMENDNGQDIVVDAGGNVATTGMIWGQGDFDPGPGVVNLPHAGHCDLFVSRLNALGSFSWALSVGTTNGNSEVHSIATDASGNVYATGSFQGTVDFDPGPALLYRTAAGNSQDIFVWRLDVNGNLVWIKTMGGIGEEEGFSIAISPSGSVLLTGEFGGTADFDPGAATYNLTSAGTMDIFIVSLDNGGNFSWAVRIGGTSVDVGYGITTDGGGNIYVTGYFCSSADFDPGPGMAGMVAASNDVFILVLDPGGNYLWAKKMGGTAAEIAWTIALDAAGNIYTAGFFTGTADFNPGPGVANLVATGGQDAFVSKLDPAGNYLWAGKMGGSGTDRVYGIAVDASGNMLTVGYFTGTADFDPGVGMVNRTSQGMGDIFVSKLGPTGNHAWTAALGSAGEDYGYDLMCDALGNAYITGAFQQTVDFDPGAGIANLTSAGSWDAFVARLNPGGNYVWAGKMGGPGVDEGFAIAEGSIYVAGRFVGLGDLDPSLGVHDAYGGCFISGFVVKLEDGPFAARDIVLEAAGGNDHVELNWQADVPSSVRFVVERLGAGGYAPLAELPGSQRSYLDAHLLPGHYAYRVKAIETNGAEAYSNISEVVLAGVEDDWAAYPNPVSQGQSLFIRKTEGTVLEAYNLQGQYLKAYVLDDQGYCTIDLPAGMYIIRLQGTSDGRRLLVR